MDQNMDIDKQTENISADDNMKNEISAIFSNPNMNKRDVCILENFKGSYFKSYRNSDQNTKQIIEELKTYRILSRVQYSDFIFAKIKIDDSFNNITFWFLGDFECTFKRSIDYWKEINYELDIIKILDLAYKFIFTIYEMHKLGIANLAINPFNIGFDNSGFMFYETCSSIHKLSELYQDPINQELQNLYISKELHSNGCESINPEKCDVFSLGIIFYNLLSFNFPHSLQDLEKNLDEMTLNDALSIFKRLIHEMISLDPLARPSPIKIIQDISEIRKKLISG